jgi:2-amino-4-hydroxy-6-hydroxymethyldihydropteridine diphosphokinase
MKLVTIYLALGTNLGDRRRNLAEAIALLKEQVTVERLSSVYETEPAYITDQPAFLNMVLRGTVDATVLPPQALLKCINAIEKQMGRKRVVRNGPRLIDLDILLYGDEQLNAPDLVIPHPHIAERDFVLVPLAEIAPDLVLPGQTKTVAKLARRLPGLGKIMHHRGATS